MGALKIGSRDISENSMPYVIAEIGVNHEGSLDKARELIDLAHSGGADAVKFQTYKAENLASRNSPSYWNLANERTTSQYELFKKYDTFGEKEYEFLAGYCRTLGIDFISTPFDSNAVNFLSQLVPCFKIASADITNFPLIRLIASKGKPIILSTGASTLAEIEMAVAEIEKSGGSQIALLHCVLNYPTPYKNAHLNMIIGLTKVFPDYIIGYSDHTVPDESMLVLTAAYLKGARIIEKHFTYDKNLPGNDHYHAMDELDLKKFKASLALLSVVGGNTRKAPLENEAVSILNARRSIFLRKSVAAGDVLTDDILICKRPGFGISPILWDKVIGKRVSRSIPADHILQWSDIIDVLSN